MEENEFLGELQNGLGQRRRLNGNLLVLEGLGQILLVALLGIKGGLGSIKRAAVEGYETQS